MMAPALEIRVHAFVRPGDIGLRGASESLLQALVRLAGDFLEGC